MGVWVEVEGKQCCGGCSICANVLPPGFVGTNVLLCCVCTFVLVRLMCDFGFIFKQSCISCKTELEFECSVNSVLVQVYNKFGDKEKPPRG